MSIRRLSTSTLTEQTCYPTMSAQGIQALVGATTGSPTTGSFTDANGFTWNYYEFTGNGSIAFSSAGFADILILGGGGASFTGAGRQGGGGSGYLRYGMVYVDASTYAITIGAGGSGAYRVGRAGNTGSPSSFGTLLYAPGGQGGIGYASGDIIQMEGSGTGPGISLNSTTDQNFGGGSKGTPNNYTGTSLNYKGSSVEYGVGGTTDTPLANTGSGGETDVTNGPGSDGVVIVRVLA